MAADDVITIPQGVLSVTSSTSPSPEVLNLTDFNITNTTDFLNVFNLTDYPSGTYSFLNTTTNTTSGYLNSSGMDYSGGTMSSSGVNEQLNAFFYIVAVLLFYSVSIVMLMIKYIKREEQECELDFYYVEFVKREHLSSFAVDPRTSHVTLSLEMFNEKEKEAAAVDAAKCGGPYPGEELLMGGFETSV